MDIKQAIHHVVNGGDCSAEQITKVVGAIMEGAATPAQIGGFLIGLRMKGETAEEIAGGAAAMRNCAKTLACPDPDRSVDTCGTGGDGSGSVNISTLAAIIAASAGARVAKHGNRSVSSRSGSADVLEALGVTIDAPVAVLERCLSEVGIAFLFAPAFHAAMRHAAKPRRELGTRTLFNLLGPLTNPAGVRNQIVGVFDAKWCEPVATALGKLGARRAFVVHGDGGLDEIAVRGPTQIAEWNQDKGSVVTSEITPQFFGLDEANPADLKGGDADANAAILRKVLGGETGAPRNAAVMEAAVALTACGVATDFRTGASQAQSAIDSGGSDDNPREVDYPEPRCRQGGCPDYECTTRQTPETAGCVVRRSRKTTPNQNISKSLFWLKVVDGTSWLRAMLPPHAFPAIPCVSLEALAQSGRPLAGEYPRQNCNRQAGRVGAPPTARVRSGVGS